MTIAAGTRYLLTPDAYFSADWLEREHSELFEQTWIRVGVEHDLTHAGDYVTDTVGHTPVLVVRGNDGEIRAFHNFCRHRGMTLAEDAGSCPKGFVCPYHRWNYGTDGALQSVPQKQQYPRFDFADNGLIPIRCETWNSMVFVNISGDAERLIDWLGPFADVVGRFDLSSLVEVNTMAHDIEANWKLYIENHVDWLHLWYLHSETLGHYDHAMGERTELGHHWASWESLTEDATTPATHEPGMSIPDIPDGDRRNGAHLIFPNMPVFANGYFMTLLRAVPTSPVSSRIELRTFAPAGADGDQIGEVLNRVMVEDYAAVQGIQKCVRSRAFAVGHLASDYEHEITRFQQMLLEHVRPD